MAATLISSAVPFEAPVLRKRPVPTSGGPTEWPVERVTYKALRDLCSVRGPWLTVSVPGHRRGAASGEPHVFIADILREARRVLAASAFAEIAERWIEPLERLAEQWRGSDAGFVWFISPYPEASGATVRVFERPECHHARVVFSTYPEVAPLLVTGTQEREFLVLALTKKQIKVYEYKDGSCSPVDLPAGFPVKLPDPDNLDHACADRHRIAKRERHFWGRVVAEFRKTFGDCKVVLFAVDEERPSFLAAAGELHVVGEISGSPDGMPLALLGKKAEAAALAGRASATGALLDNDRDSGRLAPLIAVREICDAAVAGRVRRLYVREATQFLGRLDPAVTSVTGDEDLISAAVASTLRTGGDVIAVPATSLNLRTPLTAVLRY